MKARYKPLASEVIKKIPEEKEIFTANRAIGEYIVEVRKIDNHKIMVITNTCVSIVTY